MSLRRIMRSFRSATFVALGAAVSGCGGNEGGSTNSTPAVVIQRPLLAMVEVPNGSFLMGSPDGVGTATERPRRRVTVERPFLMGQTEVTRGQFREVLGRGDATSPNLPMGAVTWFDAIEFCNVLSAREGLPAAYELEVIERDPDGAAKRARVQRTNAGGYRLPSEAEWEYACRAGTETAWSFGDDPDGLLDHGWFQGQGSSGPQAVGSLAPNPWGLLDMHGNVWEWVEDGFQSGYSGAPSHSGVWNEEIGGGRVLRGGGSLASADYCRSAYRNRGIAGMKGGAFGFRVVLDPAGEVTPPEPSSAGQREEPAASSPDATGAGN
ncbi:MAG: formylglycine-generating enzyme family protein [Phycisphaerae bacterium]|nr:formylglycine-generating enzyme family protein [Phycisphaerae bacterium]